MSNIRDYVEIYGLAKTGEFELVGGVKGIFLGSLFVWEKLSEKYNKVGDRNTGFAHLWDGLSLNEYEPHDIIVLTATLDKVIFKREVFPALLESIKKFDKEFPGSNLMGQAKLIQKKIVANRTYDGVCWCQVPGTSNFWGNVYDDSLKKIRPAKLSDIPEAILIGTEFTE
ncbi:hypothetical protein [Bacillus phage YungSlug]|nr:hypothetical protein [Bacillus phage YungSlug]